MTSWKVALVDQSTNGVPAAQLQQIAEALQRQVDNDFAPAGECARISPCYPRIRMLRRGPGQSRSSMRSTEQAACTSMARNRMPRRSPVRS